MYRILYLLSSTEITFNYLLYYVKLTDIVFNISRSNQIKIINEAIHNTRKKRKYLII